MYKSCAPILELKDLTQHHIEALLLTLNLVLASTDVLIYTADLEAYELVINVRPKPQ